jgi:hypothetical protein
MFANASYPLAQRACATASAVERRVGTVAADLPIARFAAALYDADCGRSDEARRIVADLEHAPGATFFQLALVRAALGDDGPMFADLDQAARNRESQLLYLNLDSPINLIHARYASDPRFAALAHRIGLDSR